MRQAIGVRAQEAAAYVRERYDPRAAETPWQRHYVACFQHADATVDEPPGR